MTVSLAPIQSVRHGSLSARQIELLQAIADGATTPEAAAALGIATKTAHNHLSAAYRTLDVQMLPHAVLTAIRLGLVRLKPLTDATA